MGENKRKKGEPIESKQIFKIMIYLTYIVSSVYLLKNIIGKRRMKNTSTVPR